MLNNLKNVTFFEKFFWSFFSLFLLSHNMMDFSQKNTNKKNFFIFLFLPAAGSTTAILTAKDLSPGY